MTELDLEMMRGHLIPGILISLSNQVPIQADTTWTVPSEVFANLLLTKGSGGFALSGSVHFETFVAGTGATGSWSFDFGDGGTSEGTFSAPWFQAQCP